MPAGKAEGQKRRDGPRAHGCKIAQSAGQGAVPDGLRRMPGELKMATLDGEVGRDSQLFTGSEPQQGAVVPDSESYTG